MYRDRCIYAHGYRHAYRYTPIYIDITLKRCIAGAARQYIYIYLYESDSSLKRRTSIHAYMEAIHRMSSARKFSNASDPLIYCPSAGTRLNGRAGRGTGLAPPPSSNAAEPSPPPRAAARTSQPWGFVSLFVVGRPKGNAPKTCFRPSPEQMEP